jgi:hypothetical protein
MAALCAIALVTLRTTSHKPRPAHVVERVVIAIGLIASCSGLLSLLASGLGWSAIPDFFLLWLTLGASGSPLCTLADRCLRTLFWMQ